MMNVGANFLREHVIPESRIHYAIIDAGGKAANVVQAKARVDYVLRAPQMPYVLDMAERLYKIARGAALMTETEVTWNVISGTSNLLATKAVYDRYDANLRSFLPVDYSPEELLYAKMFKDSFDASDNARMRKALTLSHPDKSTDEINKMLDAPMPNYICRDIGNTASTDAGDVTWVVPGCQLHVACYPAGTPFHSWQLAAMGKSSLVHKGMALAAKTIAMTALDFLLDNALVQQARKDFLSMLDGQTYRCPLPDDLTPDMMLSF